MLKVYFIILQILTDSIYFLQLISWLKSLECLPNIESNTGVRSIIITHTINYQWMNSKISHFWLWSWIMTFFGNRLEYFLSDWCPNRPFAPSFWEEHDMHSFAKSNENVMFMLWINKAPINHPLLIAKNIFISKKICFEIL